MPRLVHAEKWQNIQGKKVRIYQENSTNNKDSNQSIYRVKEAMIVLVHMILSGTLYFNCFSLQSIIMFGP